MDKCKLSNMQKIKLIVIISLLFFFYSQSDCIPVNTNGLEDKLEETVASKLMRSIFNMMMGYGNAK